MTDGWEAHECNDPEQVWRTFDPKRRQLFVADDAFGSTEYRPDAAERWARGLGRLLATLDDQHWLIWTSRPAPLKAGLRRVQRERGAERVPAPGEVLVDASDLDLAEKTLILFRHAKDQSPSGPARELIRSAALTIVEHPHFTPERIRPIRDRAPSGAPDVGRRQSGAPGDGHHPAGVDVADGRDPHFVRRARARAPRTSHLVARYAGRPDRRARTRRDRPPSPCGRSQPPAGRADRPPDRSLSPGHAAGDRVGTGAT